jgi:Peptidase family M28
MVGFALFMLIDVLLAVSEATSGPDAGTAVAVPQSVVLITLDLILLVLVFVRGALWWRCLIGAGLSLAVSGVLLAVRGIGGAGLVEVAALFCLLLLAVRALPRWRAWTAGGLLTVAAIAEPLRLGTVGRLFAFLAALIAALMLTAGQYLRSLDERRDRAVIDVRRSERIQLAREQRTTRNVIAETPGGRADNVVMLGAHLDSVTAGPGINDNGTGSATLLELALQLAGHPVKNKVRLAWWSAEEFGLLGSEFYVSQLSLEQQLDIALYLNFDMLGSPNFARFIYDGDDSDAVGAGPGPYGSAQIEDVFAAYFDGRGLPHEGTDFTGRSDYGPFIAVGIPAGGLFTGAEGRKTAEQAARYGGTAGQPFDSCYHQSCDTLGNVNRTILDQNADAVAWATGIFAVDTSAVNGNALARQRRADAARRAAARVANHTPLAAVA